MSELNYLSATEILKRFRDRSLSPVEYLDALEERVDETETLINAVAERLFVEARAGAKEAEALYASRSGEVRALEGLPVAAKAEHPIKGKLFTDGSLAFADRIADVTHPIIDRIVDAGGIIHLRTTTPEFSCAPFTHSNLWGVTRNPWNLTFSPGGSSGGSGASLAAGTAPLATGSDIGGSIRIPASFNGVVGYKPPYGRVPAMAPYNLDTYCHDGPLARTVADCALLQNVIAGPHPLDVVSLRPKVTIPSSFEGLNGMRIAYCVNLGDWFVDPEVEANTRGVAEALRAGGAVVEEVALDLRREDIARAAEIHFSAIFGSMVGLVDDEFAELLTPYARKFAAMGRRYSAPGLFLEGLELEAGVYNVVGPLLERYDALICPTSGVPSLIAGDDYVDLSRSLDDFGVEIDPIHDTIMTIAFNILSRCPVLAVPSGWASNDVPTGVQIVGRTYDDATVFRIGAALEDIRPWGYQHGRYPRFLDADSVAPSAPS
jgi:aspartyl-tRNA(Asn)/glutamyl-tRNA(Gln) amidotransferase subunit A